MPSKACAQADTRILCEQEKHEITFLEKMEAEQMS